MTPDADPRWWHHGACLGYPVDWFYPTKGVDSKNPATRRRAYLFGLTVCAGCPVRRACLRDILRYEATKTASSYRWGVAGGTTPDERDQIIREHRRRKTPPTPPTPTRPAATPTPMWRKQAHRNRAQLDTLGPHVRHNLADLYLALDLTDGIAA